MKLHMSHFQWTVALAMWDRGYDTLQIAEQFGVAESYIYNGFNVRREMRRNEQAGNHHALRARKGARSRQSVGVGGA